MTDKFDGARIDMLQRLGGADLVSKMTGLFEDGAPRRIAAARAAMAGSDTAACSLAIHSLRSSAGQIGATALERVCASLESQLANAPDRVAILRELDVAESELRDAVARLQLLKRSSVTQ